MRTVAGNRLSRCERIAENACHPPSLCQEAAVIRSTILFACALIVVLCGVLVLRERSQPGVLRETATAAMTAAAAASAIGDDLRSLGLAQPSTAPLAKPSVPAELKLDPLRPFLEQAEAVTLEAEQGDANAAFALHNAWEGCQWHKPLDAQTRLQQAASRIDFQRRIAEQLVAQIPDPVERERAIETIAQIDLDEARKDTAGAMLVVETFCAGMERIDWQQRNAQARHWLERAALLGNPLARRAFALDAFSGDLVPGNAAEIARLKPLVLRVVADGLAAGDAAMLAEMAVLVGNGFYAPSDPERAYVYALAYLQAPGLPDDPILQQRQFAADGERAHSYAAIDSLRSDLEGQLDAAARQRAQRSALALLAACCQGGSEG